MAAVETLLFELRLNGRIFSPNARQFVSKSIDEHIIHELTLTSNQSALSVNFGGVATGQSIFVYADQGITASFNSITAVIQTNGLYFQHLTSLTSLTITNDQTNTVAQVTVGVFGT